MRRVSARHVGLVTRLPDPAVAEPERDGLFFFLRLLPAERATHRRGEFRRSLGLHEDSHPREAVEVLRRGEPGEQEARELEPGADLANQLRPRDAPHDVVGDEEVGGLAGEDLEGGLSAVGFDDLVARALERRAEAAANLGAILGEKDERACLVFDVFRRRCGEVIRSRGQPTSLTKI